MRGLRLGLRASAELSRVVLHRRQNCEPNEGLARAVRGRRIIVRRRSKIRGNGMAGLLEPYRVSAYNTSKQSENKIHDDAVARRFGFSGGLVPGVDVMAYMMHLPVSKW